MTDRVAGDPRASLPALRRAIVEVDPSVHIGQEMTLAERTAQTFEAERLLTATVLASGAAALFLCALGMYGVLAFAVRQRCREFAIRLAIGSTPGSLRSLVLRQMLWLTVPGVLLGVGLALAGGRVLTGFLYVVEPTNLLAFVLAGAFTVVMALISGIVPTMRAARVDPVVELRS